MNTKINTKNSSVNNYTFLGLLLTLNILNTIDRNLLASFSNFIVPELALSNTQFGLLNGFLFIIFYAVMGLFMGVMADRVHRPRLIAVGVFLWSSLTAISGAARGFVSLAIPRMLIGVGESVLTPTSMSLLADRFPREKLGFAAGAYYMGVPLGLAASLLVAGYLGPLIGWRNCFFALGAIGVVLAIIVAFLPETQNRLASIEKSKNNGESEHGAAMKAPTVRQIVAIALSALRESRALRYTIAGGVCTHFVLGAATFDQLWLVQERGFERAEIARICGLIFAVGGVCGALFGGIGSDLFIRKTGLSRQTFIFWLLICCAPLNLIYRLGDADTMWFYVWMFMAVFQVGSLYGPTFAAVQELAPVRIRATVVAFYLLLLNVVGLGIGVSVTGIVVDLLMENDIASPYTWSLVGFTFLSMLAIPCFYLAGKYAKQEANSKAHSAA